MPHLPHLSQLPHLLQLPHLMRLPAAALWARALLRAFPRPRPAQGLTCLSATLPAGQATRLTLRRGEALLVREGRLWLTREGDPIDHVLWPGSGHVASVPQDVVIEAFGPQACRYERHRGGACRT